jgi:hypothetical protein
MKMDIYEFIEMNNKAIAKIEKRIKIMEARHEREMNKLVDLLIDRKVSNLEYEGRIMEIQYEENRE